MGVLEEVTQMKKRGMTDDIIVKRLREEKFSPKEIRDAMNQSQIKNAVSRMDNEGMEPSMMEAPMPEGEQEAPEQQMETPQENQQGYSKGSYIPKTKEIQGEETYAPVQEEYYAPQPGQQYSQGSQQEYSPQGYSQPYQQEGISTDTIIEIAEQVFAESTKNMQKKIDELSEFKTLSQTKIDNALERLKRIEVVMDKLQISILEKIGSYGSNLNDIKREMSMMQDSFGKIVNPLVESSEENFERKPSKQKKSVEDLFPESEEPAEQQEEQNAPEESFQQQPKRAKKNSKR